MARRVFVTGASGDIASVLLRARFGAQGRRVPKRGIPAFVVRLLGVFDPTIRQVTGELGGERACSPEHSAAVLGWRTRDEAESIVDTARSSIERGVVKV